MGPCEQETLNLYSTSIISYAIYGVESNIHSRDSICDPKMSLYFPNDKEKQKREDWVEMLICYLINNFLVQAGWFPVYFLSPFENDYKKDIFQQRCALGRIGLEELIQD